MSDHRVSIAAATLCLLAASLGCSSPANEISPRPTAPDRTAAWLPEAEADSRANLEDRCDQHAPLALVWTKHPDYVACTERTERAVQEEWARLTGDAVARCVASDGRAGCCFSRRTQDALFHAQLETCNRECASRVKGTVEVAPVCNSSIVTPADTSRFHTAPVEATVARCGNSDIDAYEECSSMPSLVERLTCVTSCSRLAVRARFVEAAKVCATAASSGGPVKCTLREDDVRLGAKIADCEELCRVYVRSPPPP